MSADVDRMTREMLSRFYVEVTNPDELGLTDPRFEIVFDLALQALDRDAVLAAVDYVLDVWEDGNLPYEQRAYVEGAFKEAMAELNLCREGHSALKREPSAVGQVDRGGSSEIGMDTLQRPGLATSETSGEGCLHVERQLSKLEDGGSHVTPHHDEPAVSAPDVASMVKRLEGLRSYLVAYGNHHQATLVREAAALLARLGQGRVPVAWMVTWNGETTDDIFCIKGAAIECMARRNRDYPNDTRTIVPLAIIPPAPGASAPLGGVVGAAIIPPGASDE